MKVSTHSRPKNYIWLDASTVTEEIPSSSGDFNVQVDVAYDVTERGKAPARSETHEMSGDKAAVSERIESAAFCVIRLE